MATKILVPSALRAFTDGQDQVALEGGTVGELLAALVERYPTLRKHLYTDEGRLRSFVNVYVNDEDVRYLHRDQTRLGADDVVSIVPSIAGGAPSSAAEELGLSPDEVLRYSRHLIMPEVALEGQRKLKAASVLVVGTGGLGTPLGLYLAAAGVGRIGLVDFDVVDFTNLQRQVTFGTRDVGRLKLDAAYDRLHDLNPEIEIVRHDVRLTSENAMDIIAGYDIVADGTDNFPTRYLINDACVLQGKPNVYASIFRFEGQATVFALDDGPCYRCLYPEPPPPGLVPSCAEGGVLGVLPGIVGAIQANETIKLILGRGENLSRRLLLFDALSMTFRELKLRRDPDCPICGEHRTIDRLIDYAQFCGVRIEEGEVSPTVPAITVTEFKRWLDAGDDVFVLDVREPHERQISHIGGELIPMRQIPARASELDSARDIVVYCRTGARSAQVVEFLRRAGFAHVWNLSGGIHAWSDQVDPTVVKY